LRSTAGTETRKDSFGPTSAINQIIYHSAHGFVLLYDTGNYQSLRDIE
jgi:hypothetical protein